jgi:hypothetical protein
MGSDGQVGVTGLVVDIPEMVDAILAVVTKEGLVVEGPVGEIEVGPFVVNGCIVAATDVGLTAVGDEDAPVVGKAAALEATVGIVCLINPEVACEGIVALF